MATFRKVGDKWVAEVYVNGTRKSKRHPTKAAARSWAIEIEAHFQSMVSGGSSSQTLGDIFTRYADEISDLKKGARWEIVRLEMFKRFPIASIKLKDLRREDLEDFISMRLNSVKPSSVNRELNLISHCLTQARRWRLMSHNPMDDLKRPKDPPHRDRLISNREIEQILIALNYDDGFPILQQQQRVAVAFLLAIETAMRAGEICSLTRPNIDFDKQTAYLPETKNGRPRTVPLSREAVRLLRKLEPMPLEGSIFNMESRTLSTLFARGIKKTTIEDLTFHDTRHEAITRLAKRLDVLDLARVSGHRDIKQLMTYYNKSAAELALQLN